MLRNVDRVGHPAARDAVLNEVLSLNAQEYQNYGVSVFFCSFLNEVLSLNAQESWRTDYEAMALKTSSMKS